MHQTVLKCASIEVFKRNKYKRTPFLVERNGREKEQLDRNHLGTPSLLQTHIQYTYMCTIHKSNEMCMALKKFFALTFSGTRSRNETGTPKLHHSMLMVLIQQ